MPQQPPISRRRGSAPERRTRRSSRGRVRVDQAAARPRGQADVRLGRERDPVRGVAHLGQRRQRSLWAESAVGSDRGHAERRQPRDRVVGVNAGQGLRVLVERELGDDRQRRHVLNGLDGGLELVQVVERLHEEQVHPRPSSSRACSWKTANASSAPVVCSRSLSGPMKPPISTGRRRPRAPRARASRPFPDLLQLIVQELRRELAPVGAEGVGLDQLGAGADEPCVDGDDRLGR